MDWFHLKDYTPVSYETPEEVVSGVEIEPGQIGINVRTGYKECSEEDLEASDGEDCEGFEELSLVFTKEGVLVDIGTMWSACPFVFAGLATGELALQGEILRNLNRQRRETSQTLPLSIPTCTSPFVVELRELKDERSFIDEVWIETPLGDVFPTQCDSHEPFCVNDGRYLSLGKGEMLRLRFPALDGGCNQLTLHANGYYLPSR